MSAIAETSNAGTTVLRLLHRSIPGTAWQAAAALITDWAAHPDSAVDHDSEATPPTATARHGALLLLSALRESGFPEPSQVSANDAGGIVLYRRDDDRLRSFEITAGGKVWYVDSQRGEVVEHVMLLEGPGGAGAPRPADSAGGTLYIGAVI